MSMRWLIPFVWHFLHTEGFSLSFAHHRPASIRFIVSNLPQRNICKSRIALKRLAMADVSPAVTATAVKAIDAGASAVTSSPLSEPAAQNTADFMTILFGGNTYITVVSTICLIEGILVTAGVAYLTYAEWKDEQLRQKYADPNSEESKEFQRQLAEFNQLDGKQKRSGIEEVEDLENTKPVMPKQDRILAEPGNREERRMKAKRRREEKSKAAAAERKAEVLKKERGSFEMKEILSADSQPEGNWFTRLFK